MRARIVVTLAALAACSNADTPVEGPGAPLTAAATTAATATVAPTPSDTSPGTADAPPSGVPVGFERVQATVTTAAGDECELCVWLAATPDQRSRGLMHVTDLGGADGMAFVYDQPRSGTFWMKDTVLPLSIAFFDVDGALIESFDMEPCTADPCERYPTPRDFLVAVETTQGDLSSIGIASGSTLELSDLACDPTG